MNTRIFPGCFITGLFLQPQWHSGFSQSERLPAAPHKADQTMELVSLSMWMMQAGIGMFKSSATSNNTDRLISLKE